MPWPGGARDEERWCSASRRHAMCQVVPGHGQVMPWPGGARDEERWCSASRPHYVQLSGSSRPSSILVVRKRARCHTHLRDTHDGLGVDFAARLPRGDAGGRGRRRSVTAAHLERRLRGSARRERSALPALLDEDVPTSVLLHELDRWAHLGRARFMRFARHGQVYGHDPPHHLRETIGVLAPKRVALRCLFTIERAGISYFWACFFGIRISGIDESHLLHARAEEMRRVEAARAPIRTSVQ